MRGLARFRMSGQQRPAAWHVALRAACALCAGSIVQTARAGWPRVLPTCLCLPPTACRYGVVKVFVGHGVGTVFHSWPHVAHHRWGRGPGLAAAACWVQGLRLGVQTSWTLQSACWLAMHVVCLPALLLARSRGSRPCITRLVCLLPAFLPVFVPAINRHQPLLLPPLQEQRAGGDAEGHDLHHRAHVHGRQAK